MGSGSESAAVFRPQQFTAQPPRLGSVTELAPLACIIVGAVACVEGSMGGQIVRLPSRFPVGTRFVIEGRAGDICLRYLEFPDGRKVDLPADLAARTKSRSGPGRHGSSRSPGRKKI